MLFGVGLLGPGGQRADFPLITLASSVTRSPCPACGGGGLSSSPFPSLLLTRCNAVQSLVALMRSWVVVHVSNLKNSNIFFIFPRGIEHYVFLTLSGRTQQLREWLGGACSFGLGSEPAVPPLSVPYAVARYLGRRW